MLALAAGLSALPLRAADALVVEGEVDAPVAEVWKAFTTAEGLRSWMAPLADIDLRVDGLMRSSYDEDGVLGDKSTIENRILTYEPERLLSIRVARPPQGFSFGALVTQMWTNIHFEPLPGERTRVRVVGLGFGPDEASQKMKAFFQRGNEFTLVKLQERFRKPAGK